MPIETTTRAFTQLEQSASIEYAGARRGYTAPDQSVLIFLGRFFFSYRDYLFPAIFLLLLLTTLPAFPFASERGDRWLDIVGIFTCCVGHSCRLLTAGCVSNIRRRGYGGQIGAGAIIQSGIFAHVRNPLYLGNLVILSGFALIANNLWWYLLVLPGFCFVYYAIVAAEEAFLLQTFGDEYLSYCRQVHRFVPRVHGLRQSFTQCTFDWKRALRREYGNLCSSGTLIFVLLIWERWERFGYRGRAVEIDELGVLLLLLFLAYGLMRWSKRVGRL